MTGDLVNATPVWSFCFCAGRQVLCSSIHGFGLEESIDGASRPDHQ